MLTLYQLKPQFQQCLRPLLKRIRFLGISANMITVLASFMSVLFGVWLGLSANQHGANPLTRLPWLLLPLFLLIRMALNALDGMMAREFDQQTALGAMLNECGDVVSDVALYAPFALLPGVNSGWVMGVLFLAIMTEFVGVLGQLLGGGRRYDGPLGKSDRAFAFGALALLYGLIGFSGVWLNSVLALMALLLVCTVIQRARRALPQGHTKP